MKKYYKSALYRLSDYYDTEETLEDHVLEYRQVGIEKEYVKDYMDDFSKIMEIIYEPTLNPYYVKERSTGLIIPVLYITETEELFLRENKTVSLLRCYQTKSYFNKPVPIFIIKRQIVHRYPKGKITGIDYPQEVTDARVLTEYDFLHQDKKQFLYELLSILTIGEIEMKKGIKARKKEKEVMPLIHSPF